MLLLLILQKCLWEGRRLVCKAATGFWRCTFSPWNCQDPGLMCWCSGLQKWNLKMSLLTWAVYRYIMKKCSQMRTPWKQSQV